MCNRVIINAMGTYDGINAVGPSYLMCEPDDAWDAYCDWQDSCNDLDEVVVTTANERELLINY